MMSKWLWCWSNLQNFISKYESTKDLMFQQIKNVDLNQFLIIFSKAKLFPDTRVISSWYMLCWLSYFKCLKVISTEKGFLWLRMEIFNLNEHSGYLSIVLYLPSMKLYWAWNPCLVTVKSEQNWMASDSPTSPMMSRGISLPHALWKKCQIEPSGISNTSVSLVQPPILISFRNKNCLIIIKNYVTSKMMIWMKR